MWPVESREERLTILIGRYDCMFREQLWVCRAVQVVCVGVTIAVPRQWSRH